MGICQRESSRMQLVPSREIENWSLRGRVVACWKGASVPLRSAADLVSVRALGLASGLRSALSPVPSGTA